MDCRTEPSLSGVKKLVQVSEEVQKPVHVPVVLGNECFVVTQQDKRKIEDVRCISYHKLGPNGELIPIDMLIGQDVALRDAIMSAALFQTQSQNEATRLQLMDMLGKLCGRETDQKQMPTRATIAQQMDWANSGNCTSPAYPFTYSTSTSMSEMPSLKNTTDPCNQNCCCSRPIKYVTNQGCNTMENESSTDNIESPISARERLKMRKNFEDTLGI